MNDHHPASIARRRWLQRSAVGAAGAFGAGSLVNLLSTATPAAAQSAASYKALVCVFLYGGNDGLNTIVPTDTTRYGQYSGVRAGLALPRASLVGLTGTDYGLHPALSALQPAWAAGKLAPVFNVGPLVQPLTKTQYRALASSAPAMPDNLFSHSDQQVLWETATGDSQTPTGWGGRASDVLGTTNPVISLGGNGHFGISALQAPLVLPGPGSTFGVQGLQTADLGWAPVAARKTALDAIYTQASADAIANDLTSGYARQQRDAFAMSDRLGALIAAQPGGTSTQIDAAFAPLITANRVTGQLAPQLYQAAKLIQGNATVQGTRQIFFVQLGGFDTHGEQVSGSDPLGGRHAVLLKQLGDALAAFHNAMTAIGMADSVTTFTQSDFGRTFKPNNSTGTDHAWGNQHLVLGGAVHGGATYGTYPTLALGGPDDVGVDSWEQQGRWIPTTSVDQYAATLLRWFGSTEAQLDAVLPNLRNYGTARGLGFV
ncbi:MAG: DUF1501 domain-containing protein [Burkholderiaceae bacterium]